ncbi:MAG: hypothetical protein AB1472_01225 [Candidatus Omnitrophota bacterium]
MSTYQKLFLIILAFTGLLLIMGLNTHLYFGDEVIHYRFAKDIYQEGRRVAVNPVYERQGRFGYFNVYEPLWHFGLALVWKCIGKISFIAAQIYHSFYYALLILLTFILGKLLYDERIGLVSSFVIATIPMFVSFSMLFYLDVPAAVFVVLFFILFFKEKYFLAGITLGILYLTKRNACFFIPAIPLLIIFKHKKYFLKIFKIMFFLFIPLIIIFIWDLIWRKNNIGSLFVAPAESIASSLKYVKDITIEKMALKKIMVTNEAITSKKFNIRAIQNSILINPIDLIKYFGIGFWIIFSSYFINKTYKKKDLWLWVPGIIFIVFFLYFFKLKADVRYLMPIIPLLIIIISQGFVSIKKDFIKKIIIGLCIMQILSSGIYIYSKRQISMEEKEAFRYIKENIPDKQLIMYPGPIILEETEKIAVWGAFYLLPYFFWGTENDMKKIIEINKLRYVAIKNAKIYDDAQEKHLGGYPRSFVEKLSSLDFIKCIYKNNAISIWQIDRNLTKSK